LHNLTLSGFSGPYYTGFSGVWSPDSSSIVIFPREDSVIRVDVSSGAQSEILRERLSDFAWGPDGSCLFGIRDKGLF
jgi:hypothetical protein